MEDKFYDAVIIGGSYSGLSAAMALGRALKRVLVIDNDHPCNQQTPHSHNFLTRDGETPGKLSQIARQQVQQYPTIEFFESTVQHTERVREGFSVSTNTGDRFTAAKLIIASGLKDQLPSIPGFSECWGISVLHCPYCHGYEVKQAPTALLANGEQAFEFASLLSGWTQTLTLLTNGPATLNQQQQHTLQQHGIQINEMPVKELKHHNGKLYSILLEDAAAIEVVAMYARIPFQQHSAAAVDLGCTLNEYGLIKTDALQQTSVPGVYACGDAAAMRSVATAVATGSLAGAAVNKALAEERF